MPALCGGRRRRAAVAAVTAAAAVAAVTLLAHAPPRAGHGAGEAATASPLHGHTAAAGALGAAHVALAEEMVAGARSAQEREMAFDVLARQDAAADAADAARLARLDAAAAAAAAARPPPAPGDGPPRLTRALLESVATPSGGVTVTWANAAFTDFTLNWVAHARGAGITNFVVGALDDDTLAALAAARVPAFAMHAGLPASDFGWGSASFHAMGRAKAALVAAVTALGFDVLVSDVDTAWLADPWPYLDRFPDADVLVSSDALAATRPPGDDRPELWPDAGAAFNIGVVLVRATARGAALAAAWRAALDAAPAGAWDQAVFNDVLRAGVDPQSARPDGLFWVAGGAALAGVLPVAEFASGHTFFVQRLAERRAGGGGGGGDAARAAPPHPTVVHATFQFSGTPGKRHRLRERRLWAVDPAEHYDPPGGFVALDDGAAARWLGPLIHAAAVPGAGRDDAAVPDPAAAGPAARLAPFGGHFRLVHAQLARLRAGVALAAALNRTLILPRLWCGADRWWAPHAGALPGAAFPAAPFRCPADHVLDLEAWAALPDGAPYRPPLAEAGLLSHPRTPAHVKGDVVRVAPCDGGAHLACGGRGGAPARAAQPGWVRLQAGLSDADVAAALAPFASARVIAFTDAAASLGAIAGGDGARAAFERAVNALTSIWCCTSAPPNEPGHVWYDAFADVAGHTDRHGRVFEGEWAPILGP